jgi:hypothetical protein
MVQFSSNKSILRSKGRNLLDDRGFSLDDLDDLSISSSVYEPVLLGLQDGELESRLDKEFFPLYDSEITVFDAENNPTTFPLQDIHYLAFLHEPVPMQNQKINNFNEVIETLKGNTFTVRVPAKQASSVGVFGVSEDAHERYKYIFITSTNIRNHFQQRLTGEIIMEKQLLSEKSLKKALNRQKQLRSLRLGTIVAKKANLNPKDVEAVLARSLKQKSAESKMQSGDILVKTGMVSPQIVKQSLIFQRKMRSIKVGKLLIDMGFMDDSNVYKALAEKFKMKFVNIHNVSPAHEALGVLDHDLLRKLKVLPIYFQKRKLLVATALPDKPELGDILRKRLSCPFELVVATHNQIIDGLANLPAIIH